ncbi:hypothetical protein SH139x_001091 [Planctomycetaceae bacterium SH139]
MRNLGKICQIKFWLLQINQADIQNVLADFDDVWDALPPREQVRVVSLLIDQVHFDGPGGNVAITFHPTGLKSLVQQPLETAQ